jgi:hypothetical protein
MKKLFMMLTFGALMATGCQCLDCGEAMFDVTPREMSFTVECNTAIPSNGDVICVLSSYPWTTQWANAADADKFKLSATSGAAGSTVIIVSVTKAGIKAYRDSDEGFVVATINFIPSQGEPIPVEISIFGQVQ